MKQINFEKVTIVQRNYENRLYKLLKIQESDVPYISLLFESLQSEINWIRERIKQLQNT